MDLRFIFFVAALHSFFCGFAQKNISTGYFRSPLDTVLFLSGTFGEPRTNHFHSGLDIKTFGQEGFPVSAAAGGFVSRIKISANGYGKAIYITHPNGYVSVYAHLQRFNIKIAEWVKQQQYEKESFEIDLFPEAKYFPVTKGDTIAFSGNSGGSTAPHLHFEIRDGKTEEPVNPLLFGVYVKDTIAPSIKAVRVYSPGKEAGITFPLDSIPPVIGINADRAAVSVHLSDRADISPNENGIYSLNMKMDEKTVFSFAANQFSFDDTRLANCHIDFAEKKKSANDFYRCFLSEWNHLKMYDTVVNRGILDLSDGKVHAIQVIAEDFAGNAAELNFKIKGEKNPDVAQITNVCCRFPAQKENNLKSEEITLHFPEKTFYDSLCLQYSGRDTAANNIYSAIHQVHNWFVPIHRYFSISVKAKNLPAGFSNKAIIAYRDEKGNLSGKGGKYESGFVVGRARELGEFFVMIDTTAPVIEPLNITEGADLKNEENIRIRIKDNLSGIDSYRAMVDGKWLLMDYDAKNSLLIYNFDERTGSGEHHLELIVKDERKNESVLKIKFKR